MSKIIKSAFDIRNETDYEDFYVVPKDDVKRQVNEAEIFVSNVEKYIVEKTSKTL